MRKPTMRGLPPPPILAPQLLSGPALGTPASPGDGFARAGLRCETDPAHNTPFEVDLSLNHLPGLQMVAGRIYGACTRRSSALMDGEAEDTTLLVSLRGRHLIEQRGGAVELGDGEAVLMSWTEPSRLTHRPPGEALALRFPRSRLAPLLRGPGERYMQVIHGGDVLGLLTRYVAMAWDEPPTASPELQGLMASHIYDLMAVLIGATPDAVQIAQAGGLQAARLNAIKEDIERSLDQPGLSVAAVAGRHGCTPRGVQRLFESEGTTFTAYVVGRRLARARCLLADPRFAAEKIIAVAHACGFGDVSYFNRVFRQQFGLAPSDVRAQAREGLGATRAPDQARSRGASRLRGPRPIGSG